MKILKAVGIIMLIGTLGACSGLSTREQRVLSGGVIGAGAGTVGAAVAGGSLFTGAAVGAAAGALGGFVYDEMQRH